MEYNAEGPILKPLLIVGGDSTTEGTRRELLSLPNGKLLYEHSLQNLHEALPRAKIIYVSIHSESQKQALTTDKLQHQSETDPSHHDHDPDHAPQKFPDLQFLINDKNEDNESDPVTALRTAHHQFPDSKFLVTSCEYPLLGPAALQQLILEYEEPVTCFMNGNGVIQPLIGIWGLKALKKMDASGGDLGTLVRDLGGKVVKPLREEWIRGSESEEELMDVLGRVVK